MLVELLSIHGGASSLGNVPVEDNVTPKSARLRKTVDFQQLICNKQFPCDAWELSNGFCCSVEKSAWCIFWGEDLKILAWVERLDTWQHAESAVEDHLVVRKVTLNNLSFALPAVSIVIGTHEWYCHLNVYTKDRRKK